MLFTNKNAEESSALFDALKDNAPTETDLAKVYHNLGNSLVKEKKLEEAINAYKSSLRINPKDKDTRHNLAITNKQKQQQEKEQENKEENKENKDEEEQDKDGENKEKEKENKEQEQSKESKEQQEEKKEKKEEMSKETAEKMLEAIQQQEKELQEELQKKKVKGKRVKVLKDW